MKIPAQIIAPKQIHRLSVFSGLLLALLLFGFGEKASGQEAAKDWPAYRSDHARSGIANHSIDVSRLELSWSWQSQVPPDPAWDGPARWDAFAAIRDLPAMRQYDACFHPVSDGQNLFFGSSSQDSLTSLDLSTGKTNWIFFANGPIRLAPSVYAGKIYFGSDDGYAYCLNSKSGKLIWKFNPARHEKAEPRRVINNDRLISFYPIRTGVTIRDGLAFFAASFLPWRESYLVALDAETGKLNPEMDTFVTRQEGATLEGSLLVTHNRIIVPQGRVAPLMFDREKGKKQGSLPGGGGVTILLTESGDVVRAEGGRSARKGQIGVFKGKDRVATFPRGRAIVVDKDRFFVVDGEKLFAAGRTNNELKWQRTVDEPLELIKSGSFLVVGGRDHVTAINANSGTVVWSAKIDGRAFGLAIAGGKLVVSTDTGFIYAFAPTADKPWVSSAGASETSQAESNWKSPKVPRVRNRSLIHRWVFHRSAMTTAKEKPVDQIEVQQVRVKDQAGNANIQLSGRGKSLKIGDSKSVEALELNKSYFSISEEIASKLPNGPISVEAWVRVDQGTTWGGIVGCIQDDGSTEHGWLLGYRDEKFCFALAGTKGGLTYLTAPDSFQLKSWNHVIGSYDGNEMRLYVNGTMVASSKAEKGPISYAAKRIFTVGAYKDANENNPLVGAIQEVRIYATSIGAPAVKRLFISQAKEFPKPEKAKVAPRQKSFLAWGPIANYIAPRTVEIRYGTLNRCESVVDLITESGVRRTESNTKTQEHRLVIRDLPFRRELQFQIRQGIAAKAKSTEAFPLDTHFDWSRPNDSKPDNWVEAMVAKSPNPRGLAIVVGAERAEQARRLAQGSQLTVVLVVKNDEEANQVRRTWKVDQSFRGQDQALVYGKNLSVLPIELSELPGAFASVVVSSQKSAESRRLVRPAGGILNESGTDVWSRDPIRGSGIWSHMYGAADNSAFGGETLSDVSNRKDLLTQWIGKPGPRYQTDRQNRKPSPLAAGGRLFLQGQQRMIALDNFSGSILWSIESPTVMRWNVPHDSSNWCADEKGVYVASDHQAWFLDGRTGAVAKQYEIPGKKTEGRGWGYIARQKNLLLGTSVQSDAIYRDWWGKQHWFDSTGGDDTHVVAGDNLFALDVASGKRVWSYEGLVLHPTITIKNDRIYFVEDRTVVHQNAARRRISLDAGQEHVLVCLSLSEGKQIWEQALPSFDGHVSVLYLAAGGNKEHKKLVMVASEATKKQFSVSTFDLEKGEPGWTRRVNWETNHHGKHISRPAIQGDLVYLRPEVLKLESGETLTRGFPSGHGCSSYTLSTNGLFSRLGDTTWWDFRNKKVHRFNRMRTDCWISVIPAQGMVLSAEGGGGCSCGSWLETSLGFLPRSVDQKKPEK